VSDTPRTDAAAIRCACSTYVVPSEFARELERENIALREDKERLDWLEQSHKLWEGKDWLMGPEFISRAAIDAARKEKP
jgi:hypothetical protein